MMRGTALIPSGRRANRLSQGLNQLSFRRPEGRWLPNIKVRPSRSEMGLKASRSSQGKVGYTMGINRVMPQSDISTVSAMTAHFNGKLASGSPSPSVST